MEIKIAPVKEIEVTHVGSTFEFPFDYLRKGFVHTTINDEEADVRGFTVVDKSIVFDSPLQVGDTLKIYRSTPTTPLVSWADASVLKAKDMTIQQVQELHILEEEDYRFQGIEDRVDNLVDTAQAFVVSAENSAIEAGNKATDAQNAANFASNAADDAENSATKAEKLVDSLPRNFDDVTKNVCFINRELKLIAVSAAETGDSTIITTPTGKVIVVDALGNTDTDNFFNALQTNNITHVDYCVVSHYHGDHIAGFLDSRFLTYIDNTTVFYLPMDIDVNVVNKNEPSVTVNYNNMMSFLSTSGVVVEKITQDVNRKIDKDIDFEFLNTDHSIYYQNEAWYYNDACLCFILRYKDKKVFFSGDIGEYAQRRILGKVGNVDVYKVQHHGSDWRMSQQFLMELNPKFSYCMCSSTHYYDYYLSRGILPTFKTCGKAIYTTGYNGTFTMLINENGIVNCSAKYDGDISLLFLTFNTYSTDTDSIFKRETTLQQIVDIIPPNTYVHIQVNTELFPNILGTDFTSLGYVITGVRGYNKYYVLDVIDIATSKKLVTAHIANGIVTLKRSNRVSVERVQKTITANSASFSIVEIKQYTDKHILGVNFYASDDLYYALSTDNLLITPHVIYNGNGNETVRIYVKGAIPRARTLSFLVTYEYKD